MSLFGYFVVCEADDDHEWFDVRKGFEKDLLATTSALLRALKVVR